MTVGGKTNGKATIAPIAPFQAECVRASHQAMGVPMTSRSTVTTVASFKVNQTAERSELSMAKGIPYRSYPYDLMMLLALSPFM